jgi:hypothetical protein
MIQVIKNFTKAEETSLIRNGFAKIVTKSKK